MFTKVIYMCDLRINQLKNINEYFNLEVEMISFFGEEKTKKVLSEIKEYYKTLLPLEPESISFSGNGRYNQKGDFLTEFEHKNDLFNYLITFRRRTYYKGVEVDETVFYAFN